MSVDDLLADELEYGLMQYAMPVREVQLPPLPARRLPTYDQIIDLIHFDFAVNEHRAEMYNRFGAHRLL